MCQIVLAIGAIALSTACGGGTQPTATATPLPEAKTLREQADRAGFLIGTTISGNTGFARNDAIRNSLIGQEFNYVTDFVKSI